MSSGQCPKRLEIPCRYGKSAKFTIGEHGGVHWDGFSDTTPEELAVMQTTAKPTPPEPEVPCEDNPIRKLISHLLTKRPEGGFWSYEELKDIGTALLGFVPFADAYDLRAKLFRIAGKLRDREGIVVRGHKGNRGIRGIRIEQISDECGTSLCL